LNVLCKKVNSNSNAKMYLSDYIEQFAGMPFKGKIKRNKDVIQNVKLNNFVI